MIGIKRNSINTRPLPMAKPLFCFTNEIFWYLINESLHISPNSLQYASIEKIAYEIKGGKNINLKLLPERLEKEVNLFMHYRFY